MGRNGAHLQAAAFELDDVDIIVRRERPGDAAQITRLVERAFSESRLGYHGEAQLLDCLRKDCPAAISLVAEQAGTIIGQIQFSPAQIVAADREWLGLGLGPVSVL